MKKNDIGAFIIGLFTGVFVGGLPGFILAAFVVVAISSATHQQSIATGNMIFLMIGAAISAIGAFRGERLDFMRGLLIGIGLGLMGMFAVCNAITGNGTQPL